MRYKGDKDDGIRRIVEDDKRGDGVRTLSSVKVEKAWERIRRVSRVGVACTVGFQKFAAHFLCEHNTRINCSDFVICPPKDKRRQ